MNPANITIAVLDRNPEELGSLAAILEDAGYRVLTTTTQAHIERFFATQPINLVAKGFDAALRRTNRPRAVPLSSRAPPAPAQEAGERRRTVPARHTRKICER